MKSQESAPIRVALLGSFTLELLARYVAREFRNQQIDADLYVGGYSQYQQDLLDPNSSYYRYHPAYTLLLVEALDVFPAFYFGPSLLTERDKAALVQERLSEFRQLVVLSCARMTNNQLLIAQAVFPGRTILGPLEWNSADSVQEHIAEFNAGLARIGRDLPNAHILDLPGAALEMGYARWRDPRLWYLARCRLSHAAMEEVARLLVASVGALHGKRRKCLVLDLDNTLWGGIAGNDALEELHLGPEGIGLAFYEFQRLIRQLKAQGILLAINSKNNFADAMEIIEKHPWMILRREDFAAIRINWSDKTTNMHEISEELGLGMDSFVYFDDSPFERNLIRSQLPEVLTVEVPADPTEYVDTLSHLDAFWTFALTDEDRTRHQKYKLRAQRESMRKSARSLKEFYSSLQMKAVIRPGSEALASRVSQVTQRTNQFNLTTKRYDPGQIRQLLADDSHRLWVLELSDRFGSEGIVGVAVMSERDGDWGIDTFLLSCRVIGRTVEQAFLAFISAEAKRSGARRLVGRYLPTPRNSCVAELYPSLGFQPTDQPDEWALDLDSQTLASPPWIEVTSENE